MKHSVYSAQFKVYLRNKRIPIFSQTGQVIILQESGCSGKGEVVLDLRNSFPMFGEPSPMFGDPFPIFGDAFPKFGEALPKIGEAIIQFGETFPEKGESFPEKGEAIIRFGEALPKHGESIPPIGEAILQQKSFFPRLMETKRRFVTGYLQVGRLRKAKVLLLLLLLTIITVRGNCQDSLANYLTFAAKNNPTVLQRYAEYEAAVQKVPQVGALPDLQLDMGVFLSPMELMAGNQVAEIKLMQMFPWFGVIRNAKDEMSLMAKGKYELFRDAKLQVYYDVQRVWFDLYKIRRNIELSEKNVELLKTIERLSLAKFRSGTVGGGVSSSGSNTSGGKNSSATSGSSGMNSMGGNATTSGSSRPTQAGSSMGSSSMGTASGSTSGLSGVYQVQIEMAGLEDNIAALKNEEQVAVARLNSLLNRPLKTPVDTMQVLQEEPLDIAWLTMNDSVLSRNPMLGMLQYEQQSLAARTRMQKRMGLPMVGLGLNYSVINKSEMSTSPMNGEDMIMPMVSVTLPVYRKKYKAMQAETNLLKKASEYSYQATANALQTEYAEALQLYNDAQRRMKLYANQSQLARKSLDLSIKTFSSSADGLSEILRIRQQLLDYQQKQVEALVDFNQAKAWIKRITPGPKGE